jgi:hypothetical protein
LRIVSTVAEDRTLLMSVSVPSMSDAIALIFGFDELLIFAPNCGNIGKWFDLFVVNPRCIRLVSQPIL